MRRAKYSRAISLFRGLPTSRLLGAIAGKKPSLLAEAAFSKNMRLMATGTASKWQERYRRPSTNNHKLENGLIWHNAAADSPNVKSCAGI
jgi:hypothetical protein